LESAFSRSSIFREVNCFHSPPGYLKPRAEEERRIAAEEKKRLDELKRIERELAEGMAFSLSQHPRVFWK
jgi:hypothetical protein